MYSIQSCDTNWALIYLDGIGGRGLFGGGPGLGGMGLVFWAPLQDSEEESAAIVYVWGRLRCESEVTSIYSKSRDVMRGCS